MNRKYPIGIQSFENIRKEGYLYVDKTALIYQLVQTGKYYFLSRPRRFGKSLLLSTLQAYYEGKKELFDGLAMASLEKDWKTYPVLHLDLNAQRYDSVDSLTSILNDTLCEWERLYGTQESETTLSLRFKGVIQRAAEKTGRNVVVLIDEYDKPMLQAIHNKELQSSYRNILKAFYGVLKSKDAYLQFALLTGVTKFSKVSVFSDLNNLMDISMDNRYAAICGITEQELVTDLGEYIRDLSETLQMSYEDLLRELQERYDGYHFVEDSEGLYNPFSLLNTFARKKLGNYWFETGTPTYLVELLKENHYPLEHLTYEQATADTLTGIDTVDSSPIPVLYQSGYLTIKDYDPEFETYTLGFPNKEVEEGFTRFLLPYYAHIRSGSSAFHIVNFVKEVRSGDIDGFMKRLQSFFSDTPYELVRDLELHYQNVLFIIFRLVGFYTQAEYHTSEGRVDLVIRTDQFIYVMEFKLDGTAEEALQQIEEKQYALPFVSDSRRLFKVGVNFSNATRNIEKWLVR